MKHIDTLYLYRVVETRDEYYSLLSYVVYSVPHVNLGEANGRQWFQLDKCRIGVMDWDKSLRSNQYPFIIQYDWEYLFVATKNIDIDMIDIFLPLLGGKSDYKVARIDFSITRSDASLLKDAISPFRSRAIFEKGGNLETVYFGKRSNGLVFRAYDKTVEMKSKDSFLKMDYLSKNFGTIENLTVFELEMHRKFIIKKIDNFNDSLDGLSQIYALYLIMVGNIRFFEDTDLNLQKYKNRNYDDIAYSYSILDFLENLKCFDIDLKTKTSCNPSFDYLVKSIYKKILNYSNSRSDIDFVEVIDRILIAIDDDDIGEYHIDRGVFYRSLETLQENSELSV